MNFIKNKLEDWENYVVEAMNSKGLRKIRKETEKLEIFKKSLDYRQADTLYLFQEGFSLEEGRRDTYVKEEDIDYGEYPGRYRITVHFPDAYPKVAPMICFKPLFKGEYCSHLQHAGTHRRSRWDDGHVCIANASHVPDSYWKSNMNARGALMLGYNIATGEHKRKRGSRREIPIKGTIFETISKAVSRDDFIREFMMKHGINDIDRTFTWGELAFKVSEQGRKVKGDLVKYCNMRKK